jgi:DNA polymerase I-like protein with 3'-5' exonuclease and polymerase domains
METMALLHQRLPALLGRPMLVLQVHDEFIIEVDETPEAVKAASRCLEQCMLDGFAALLPGAPLTTLCDVADGQNWAEIH